MSPRTPTLLPRGRVLVLAADPAVALAVHALLVETHDVAVCNDPREALLGIARGDEYDIVLCDAEIPFVPAVEFRDQVAAMDEALGERVVFFPFDESEAKHDGTPLSAQLDVAQLKARVAELVSLRTLPPRGRYRASR